MTTLTRNVKGQYVPFVSRALNSPALAKALAGRPLHAMIRKLGRVSLGHSTEAIDQNRNFWGKVAKRRELNKVAGHPRHTRVGAWTRTRRAMCGRSWRK